MSHRLRRCLATASLAALPLASCGPSPGEFAPPCPTPLFEQSLSDITRYRNPSDTGDLTELVLQGRLVSVNGQCKLAGGKGSDLLVQVRVGMQITRGPALAGNTAEVPVFIAVTDGETILDKQVYSVTAAYPSNVQMVALSGGPIEMRLPLAPSKSGAAYQIRVGFQLTPDELAANRHRLGIR